MESEAAASVGGVRFSGRLVARSSLNRFGIDSDPNRFCACTFFIMDLGVVDAFNTNIPQMMRNVREMGAQK